jgi:hypothetical protein
MQLKKEVVRTLPVMSIAALAMLSVVGCSERKPTPPPAPASAPSTASPSSSSPPVAPGSVSDVTKKGTETGMVGGESGTVASSGKPGTGTSSGAGTGAAESSDSKTENKK